MKKTAAIACFLIAFAAQRMAAQATAPVDLVVLMDNSESVFGYYDEMVDYVITYVIKDYLRNGDTFHLLSFSGKTEIELAQKIRSEADLKAILGRLYMLYPIGKATDLISSLGFLYQYIAVIPENSRKVAVIITDGVHNPEKSSQYHGLDAEGVRREIDSVAKKMRDSGWTVILIRVPFSKEKADPAASPGNAGATPPEADQGMPTVDATPDGEETPVLDSGNLMDALSGGLGVTAVEFNPETKSKIAEATMPLPKITYPGHLGKQERNFSARFKVENHSDREVFLELAGAKVLPDRAEILESKTFLRLGPKGVGTLEGSFLLPESEAPGEKALSVELEFSNGVRVLPSSGTLSLDLAPNPLASFFRTGKLVVIFLITLILAVVLSLVVFSHLHRRIRRESDNHVIDTVSASLSRTASAGAAPEPGDAPGVPKSAKGVRVASAPIPAVTGVAPAAKAAVGAREGLGKGQTPDAVTDDARTRVPATMATDNRKGDRPQASIFASLFAKRPSPATAQELPGSERREASGSAAPVGTMGIAARNIPETSAWNPYESAAKPANEAAKAVAHRDSGENQAIKLELKSETTPESADWRRLERVKSRKEIAEEKRSERLVAARTDVDERSLGLRIKKQSSAQILFTIEEQNPNIGMRNVHRMKSGARLDVGSRSDFLVFVIHVPSRIARVYYDGENLTFIPLRKEFFPDLDGVLENCLGKTIRAVSKGGFEMRMRFEEFVPPAERFNSLLRVLEIPSLPGMDAAR